MSQPWYPIVIWATDPQLPTQLLQALPCLHRLAPPIHDAAAPPAGAVLLVQLPAALAQAAHHVPATLLPWLQPPTRAASPDLPPSRVSPWSLEGPPYRLRNPQGGAVRLSAAEARLLHCLATAGPHTVVSRARLHAALGLASPNGTPHPTDVGYRALNMRISRVRQKARGTGMHLHLEAVAGEGYCLGSPTISQVETPI